MIWKTAVFGEKKLQYASLHWKLHDAWQCSFIEIKPVSLVPVVAVSFFLCSLFDHVTNVPCAGWICYAEKTHGSYILPHISTTKSPQQMMGSLVKSYLPTLLEDATAAPNMLYHVAVMPCYDKKLEASRQDFYDDIYATRDVDCVITTGQFIMDLFYFLNYLTLPLGRQLSCC